MKFKKPRHRYLNSEPGAEHGTGTAAPAEPPAPAPAPADTTAAPAPAPAPAEPPAEPFAGLSALLDNVGKGEGAGAPVDGTAAPAAAPAPAAPGTPDDPAAPPPAPAAPAPAPKDPTAADLTPPDGMSDRAKTRWADLTERVKSIPELERRAVEATQQLESVRQMVSQSGLDAAEFGTMLDIGRLYKSDKPQDLQTAMQQLDTLRADIATRLGVDAPGLDILTTHPDLKAKVEAMEMPRDAALEIVRLRNANATSQAATQQQREFQTFQGKVQSMATNMDAELAKRSGTPGHESKVQHVRAYFSDQARLQSFVQTYQPEQWLPAVMMMYDSFTPPPPAAPAVQPLRPTQAAAGTRVSNQPVTAEAAVSGAFDRLGL